MPERVVAIQVDAVESIFEPPRGFLLFESESGSGTLRRLDAVPFEWCVDHWKDLSSDEQDDAARVVHRIADAWLGRGARIPAGCPACCMLTQPAC